jgi:hypothetical protein
MISQTERNHFLKHVSFSDNTEHLSRGNINKHNSLTEIKGWGKRSASTISFTGVVLFNK